MFDDERLYNAPFGKVQNHLKLMSIDAIGTPAEPVVIECGRYQVAPAWADKHHAIDMYAGDLDNFDDCHTVQLKTIQRVNSPGGFIGIKFERDEYSQVARVSRYCEYTNVEIGVRADSKYPKSYVFMQWNKAKPHLNPAWFVIVDTIALMAGLRDVVEAICGNTLAQSDLTYRHIHEKTGGRNGQWAYDSGRLEFTLDLLDKLGVPYYLYPASKRVGENAQCHLF